MFNDPIAEARYTRPDGSVQIVQPVGTTLQPGNKYYTDIEHSGHLRCLHCEAAMRFQEKAPSAGGSSGAGGQAFFTPVKKHDDDCIVPLRPANNRKIPVDRTKGYRLNINTASYSELFNQKAGVYDVSANGRLRLSDEDMRDRETFTIKEAEDLVRFINKADTSRIKSSRVIFQNNAENWEEFFIRKGTPSRLFNLIKRLEARRKGAEPPFVAMEVTTTGFHNPYPRLSRTPSGKSFHKVPPAPVEPIELGPDHRGKKTLVKICVYIDERTSTRERDAMLAPDTYLVMGEARHKSTEMKDMTIHYINIKVTDGRQVTRVNIENLRTAKMPAPAPDKP